MSGKANGRETDLFGDGRKGGKKGWRPSRRLSIAFFAANGIFAVLAVLIRFTTPQVVLTPLAYVRPVELSTTNICQKIDTHILSITRTPTEPTIAQFDSRIIAMDTYMTRVMMRLPQYSQGVHDKKFIETLHALKRITVEWCTDDKSHTIDDAYALKAKIVAFRPQFSIISQKKYKPTPLWYMHIARISYGFTEGLATPYFALKLLYDKARMVLFGGGKRKKVSSDWRRDSIFFAFFRLYGAIICGFCLMAMAQKTKIAVVTIISICTVLYGTLAFAAFCSEYADRFDNWFKPKMENFFEHFSFGMGQKKS